MSVEKFDVIVIGAGLCGLSLAYYLRETGLNIKILEARSRIGGRINTLFETESAPVEMGATWLGAKHKSLIGLLDELEIKTFKQEMGKTAVYEPISTSPHQMVSLPPNNDPSYRIVDGTSSLINALAKVLDANSILLNEQVRSIDASKNEVLIETRKQKYFADKVVSTLPPNLLQKTISITPQLPDDFETLMKETHTWMSESIKVALTYKTPFWRDNNLSGTIVSNVGPIPEMYEHSNYEDSHHALKGFLNGNYFSVSKSERLEMILRQLSKYYGDQVKDYIKYEECVWRNETLTFHDYDSHVLPHQNNGHPNYQLSQLAGRFYIGGAETAKDYPGYMDGAVASAKRIAKMISKQEK